MNFGKTGAVLVGKHLPYMEHIKPHFFVFTRGQRRDKGWSLMMKITLHRARRPKLHVFTKPLQSALAVFKQIFWCRLKQLHRQCFRSIAIGLRHWGWCFPAIKIRWLNLQMEQFLISEFLVFCRCLLISRHALCRGCACKKHAANEMQESCLSRNKTVSKHTSKQQPLNIWLINYPKSVVPVPSLSP